MCNMLGLGDMNADQLASKLEETLPVIRSVSEQFKDPVSDSRKLVLRTRKRGGSVHVIFLLGERPVTLHLAITEALLLSCVPL